MQLCDDKRHCDISQFQGHAIPWYCSQDYANLDLIDEHHNIDGSRNNFVRICSITRASISGGTRWLGLSQTSCLKNNLGNELGRVCRNSQTLQQHMKNDHKERRKAWQKKKKSFAKQS